MTSVTLNLRSFGPPGDSFVTVWPQDSMRATGLDVVPGIVVEMTTEGKADTSQLCSAIRQAMGSIACHWKQARLGGFDCNDRAIVQMRTSSATPGSHESCVVTDLQRSSADAVASEATRAFEKQRDLVAFCRYLQPAFTQELAALQRDALTATHATRLRHLSNDHLWTHTHRILMAYGRRAGVEPPITLMDQVELMLIHLAHDPCAVKARTSGATWSASVAIRTRPLRLLPPASGSGIILCGAGTDHLPRRGSFAPTMGLDYVESGACPVASLDALLVDPVVSQRLDEINRFMTKMNGYFRVAFILENQRIFVDSITPFAPTAELAIANAAARLRLDSAPSFANALENITATHVRSLLYPRLELSANDTPIAEGIPGAPGACSGVLCTSSESVLHYHAAGVPLVYCASSPTPEAMRAMAHADGAVFQTGGVTSHIAVIARGLGKPCILAINALEFADASRTVRFGSTEIRDGQWVSVDGTGGRLFLGRRDIASTPVTDDSPLFQVLAGCEAISKLQILVNADNAAEAQEGIAYGASGIGLCRIEHMLATPQSSIALGRAITLGLSTMDTSARILSAELRSLSWKHSVAALQCPQFERRSALESTTYRCFIDALERLKDDLRKQFVALFAVARGRPITIRFLDPPLREFVSERIVDELLTEAVITGAQAEAVKRLLHTSGGMLGLRGVRLGLVLAELTEMQALAIYEAACESTTASRLPLTINLLAPLVSDPTELQLFRLLVLRSLSNAPDTAFAPRLRFGAMIETPRAALMADTLATIADFLSFGTNDLSQFVWACSRDSAEIDYLQRAPYSAMNCMPFTGFDDKGVGALMAQATTQAKRRKPLQIGVCGEHARDHRAVRFFAAIGIDYVSCAPSAVPEARLAAAQVAIRHLKGRRPPDGLSHDNGGEHI